MQNIYGSKGVCAMRTKNKINWLCKRSFFICFFILGICFFASNRSYAQLQDVVDTKENDEVFLHRGDLVSLKVYSLTRIAVSKPGIVDIANADVDEVLLIGQTIGETPIFIWDEYGKRMVTAHVIEEDLDSVIHRIQSLLDSAHVKGLTLEKNFYEGKIVATGKFNKDEKTIVDGILGQYGSRVINMVRDFGDLIQIDVQISELNTTLTKVLGIDWNTGGQGIVLQYEESLPSQTGKVGDLFKIGDFGRTTAIIATVNALIQEGKGRVLSKPSILVTNGEEASFLVGGEIPIRTTTTSTGGASVQENVTFTAYGIDLTVTPEIKEDKIDIEMNVQIRDVDAANAVGENVAFTTRTARTKLLLNDSQTIVLAGLIKHNQGETVTRVPFLSAIPVVGLFFRNKSYSPNQDQEVVISLTPRVVKQQDPNAVKEAEKQVSQESAKTPSESKEQSTVKPADTAPEEKITPEPEQNMNPAEEMLMPSNPETPLKEEKEEVTPKNEIEENENVPADETESTPE